MPLYDRSARETLQLPEQEGPFPLAPWSLFDPDWYRSRYPGAPTGADGDLLEWHLNEGQGLGHSPNPWFSEEWQREAWPGILAAIEAGEFASAFDAWCRGANASRAPHWLFDPLEYARRYPLLTDDALAAAGLINLYDHYLRFGAAEGRAAHPLFDPDVYRADLDGDAPPVPFAHFLLTPFDPDREPRTSALFDPGWYRDRYPAAADAVRGGQYGSLLEHYLRAEPRSGFDPSPWFSEAYYLATNPGLADAIGPGGFRDGFAHFLTHGLAEGRSPYPGLDLAWYASQEAVQADIAAGLAADAYRHWIAIGAPSGHPGTPPPPIVVTEAQAIQLHQRRSRLLGPSLHRHRLDFTFTDVPPLSVVMKVQDRLEDTMLALAALRAAHAGPIELIVFDPEDSVAHQTLEYWAEGATVMRFGTTLSAAAVRDAGLIGAQGAFVLFLGDGIEPAPGAIEAARARLAGDPAIGVVGGRLVRADGTLLDAGGIVWRDGTLTAYGAGGDPAAPEVTFTRDADFVSPLFLMARSEVLNGLPEPAEGIAGSAHEAADLCLRVQEAGYRVVDEPDALAFLTGLPPPMGADGTDAFLAAHAAYLSRRPVYDPGGLIRARSPDRGQVRVLVIEDWVPLRRLGSGFVRSNDILHAMEAAGAEIVVFPMNGSRHDPSVARTDLPPTVEIRHDMTAADFPAFAAGASGRFDVVWVARTHNLAALRPVLTELRDAGARVILDTEAIAAEREAERAALSDTPFDRDAARAQELSGLDIVDHVVAVTEAEAAIVRAYYPGPVSVLGHTVRVDPTERPFAERSGILFVGALHGTDHPNYDGLLWFADRVLPLIDKVLGWETRLIVAGHVAPGIPLDTLRPHPRITLRGEMADLRPLYEASRVFIAPTRFAAGLPYKVHEAAAHGLPVVATPLLARQLGWTDKGAVGIADPGDPEAFAAEVIALYRDPDLWLRRREAALALVASELGSDRFDTRVARMLKPVEVTRIG